MARPRDISRLLLVSALVVVALAAIAALALYIAQGRSTEPLGMVEGAAPSGDADQGAYLDLGRAVVVGATGHPLEAACRACHGMDGSSNSSGAFPRLSELHEWYLYKQLRDYASGARPNAIMTPIAAMLTEAETRAVARYYASQDAPFVDLNYANDPLALQRAGTLVAIGDSERAITACAACHGPLGQGAPPVTPPLAGQYAAYITLQLDLFKRSERANDVAQVMRDVAAPLTRDEMVALGLYYASIRPPEDSGTGP